MEAEEKRTLGELYLDTTYCNPNYDFPRQKVALECMQKIVLEALREEPKTLFTCSAYSVGKEKAFKAIDRCAILRGQQYE